MNPETLRKIEPEPEESDKGLKILQMPGAEEERKKREIEEEAPKGDPKAVWGRLRVDDEICFSRTGEAGYQYAVVVGREKADNLKLHLLDNGKKRGRIIILSQSDISAIDVRKGAYDYLRKDKK